MKRTRSRGSTLWVLAALSALVVFPFGGGVQASPVTLLNPGFESGPATNSPPTNWVTTGTAVAAYKNSTARKKANGIDGPMPIEVVSL